MNTPTLPPAWLDVIGRVRNVLPSAIIAGGAIRDLDNDRPVKDIDVFFTDTPYFSKLHEALYGVYFYAKQCSGQYMDGAADEVTGTTTYLSHDGSLPELNLIQLTEGFNPADIIDRVDFGICQIGYDLLGVVKTPAYEFDKANQCFSLTRAETVEGVMRSIKRYQRLQQKYQGWPLTCARKDGFMVEQAYQRLADEGRLYTTYEQILPGDTF